MKIRGKPALWVVLLLSCLIPSIASSQPPDLTYHTIAPCAVVDTRLAGGAFAPGQTRTYNVVGSGSLAGQGGSPGGCGIPGFSNNIPQVQAVALNIVAATPAGLGNVRAFAADTTTTTTVLNFTAGENVANTAPVAVAQTSGAGDFKITVNVSSAHIVISVVGYYSKAVQTAHVHPVPGDHTASGTRLINALAAITGASATKRYVIKLEPGIYDVGSTMLLMKPYVDIEGSGQEATVIQGNGNSVSFTTATVQGADFAELRDLQVKSVGAAGDSFAVGIVLDNADTTIRNVTVVSGGAITNWGIRISGSSPLIEETTIEATGASTVYGLVTVLQSHPVLRRTIIDVLGTTSNGDTNGIFTSDDGCPSELMNVEIDVAGGSTAYGFRENLGTQACTTKIQGSSISAASSGIAYGINLTQLVSVDVLNSKVTATASTSYGITSNIGSVLVRVNGSEVTAGTTTVSGLNAKIGATFLNGGAATATCAGVYDESYTFYASTCP